MKDEKEVKENKNVVHTINTQKKKQITNMSPVNDSINLSLYKKKHLALRDLRHQNEELSMEHAQVKQILQEKQSYFSMKEKKHNADKEKALKEYEQAIKDNQDRQVILEEKIKNKEKKIKIFDAEIKQYKLLIQDLHDRIKKAGSDIEEREHSLTFLTKFKNDSTQFVQLDMFDRLETIFNSEDLIRKKKEELITKIHNLQEQIKNMEENCNSLILNKEKEYKQLVQKSQEAISRKKKVEDQLKENINEHNQKTLLLNKINISIDNFLSRLSSFLPELRHYNKKNKDKINTEKKSREKELIEDVEFTNVTEMNDLEKEIIKKLDIIYKYIKDTIYIIDRAKKEITLKDEYHMDSLNMNLDKNIEFFTYSANVKSKNL